MSGDIIMFSPQALRKGRVVGVEVMFRRDFVCLTKQYDHFVFSG